MRVYHVYNLKTGEIFYSAPDYRAAVEMRDACKADRYHDGSWQIGSTMADENGFIDGELWYNKTSYTIQAEADRKLSPVAGPYRDEIIVGRAIQNERSMDRRKSGRVQSSAGRTTRTVQPEPSTDYSGFGV